MTRRVGEGAWLIVRNALHRAENDVAAAAALVAVDLADALADWQDKRPDFVRRIDAYRFLRAERDGEPDTLY